MKTVLVYYPFPLAKDANSGSKLRPLEMKKAFEAWGKLNSVKVILISGTTAERRNQFQEHLQSGALEDLWFCYMENQTIPLWLTDPGHRPRYPFIDRQILKFLKSKNVPVGVFYRDVYWKFDHIYPLKGYKKAIMQSIYKMEEKFYEKYCDVIFLPSLEMGKYVNINKPMVDLPPGGKKQEIIQKGSNTEPYHAIYVGAIKGEDYGLDLLLGSFEIINSEQQRCKLTIVCRQPEYESLTTQQKEKIEQLKINVMHVSGEMLDELYKTADFALIPRKCTEYQHFSMPVKLVEYLSNNLPIVATACHAQKRFLGENGYGIICDDEEASMAEAIGEMMESLDHYQDNIQQTFMKNHSWLARVERVKDSLVGSE